MEKVSEKSDKKGKYGKYDEWEVKGAARTLQEAEKIKKNKELLKHVEKCLKEEKIHVISSLEELRSVANSKENHDSDDMNY